MYPRLRKLRESLGMTQEEFGKSLNIAKSTYNNYETGIRDPKSDFWVAVAQKYGITIDYLMGYSDDPHSVGTATKKAPPISDEAMKLAEDYDSHMDTRGRETVRGVADLEVARYKARESTRKDQSKMEAAEEIFRFIVPGYSMPMSAGTGLLAGEDEYPENYALVKEPPRGTSFIAPVSGDSMEPTLHDGDKLFIHSCTEIRPGQIGVFFMDGQQWVKELGDGVLISHNQDYDPIPMMDGVECQGLVLGVCDESYFE